MSTIYQGDDFVTCPHCLRLTGEIAQDCVAPSRMLQAFEDFCEECGGDFTVTQTSDDAYEVEKIDG